MRPMVSRVGQDPLRVTPRPCPRSPSASAMLATTAGRSRATCSASTRRTRYPARRSHSSRRASAPHLPAAAERRGQIGRGPAAHKHAEDGGRPSPPIRGGHQHQRLLATIRQARLTVCSEETCVRNLAPGGRAPQGTGQSTRLSAIARAANGLGRARPMEGREHSAWRRSAPLSATQRR